eukprot:4172392-Pleurochrysis_carterae.AAC.2
MESPMTTSGCENCEESLGQSLPMKGTASSLRESGACGAAARSAGWSRPNATRDTFVSTCGRIAWSQSRQRLSSLNCSSERARRIAATTGSGSGCWPSVR